MPLLPLPMLAPMGMPTACWQGVPTTPALRGTLYPCPCGFFWRSPHERRAHAPRPQPYACPVPGCGRRYVYARRFALHMALHAAVAAAK